MLAAFDPSTTRFGFAFGDAHAPKPKSGVWRLPGADELLFDRTLGLAAESVSNLLKAIGASHVVIEAPIIVKLEESNAHTLGALLQLSGVVRAASYRAGCKIKLVPRISVLKIFTGKGRWDEPKDEVMAMCRALHWDFADDNAADACAAWAFGLHHFFQRPVHPLLARAVA